MDKGFRRFRLLSIVLGILMLAACASNNEQRTVIQDLQEGFDAARESALKGNHRRAIQIYELIQARYPFSEFAKQVQLELMYSYYKIGQPELAIEAADTFMRENPTDPRIDYALYIKGLAYFERGPGYLTKLLRIDASARPPKNAEIAYSTLRRLVERYPASEYAPDARQRIIYLKNRLAAYENTVADFYIRRGAYIAALNRARASLEQFNGSPANAESLELMIRAYEELGMDDLAADTRRVLNENFPNRS